MWNNLLRYFSRIRDKPNSGLLIFDWLTNIDLFTLLPRSMIFLIKKHGGIWEEFRDVTFSLQTQLQQITVKEHFNQMCKNKARTILWKKQKNKCDPKIETVKYLEIIDQNKTWLILNTASKVFKFPGHASNHSTFNIFFTKFQIFKVQKLNFRNLKFEKIDSILMEYIRILCKVFLSFSTLK